MTDKAKLENIKKLADAMYYAAFNLTTDASLLRKAMNEYHQFIIRDYHKEEPVSEELVDTTQTITYNGEVYTRCYRDGLDAFACKYPMSVPKAPKKYAKYSDVDLTIAVKEGAKFQKQQLMKDAIEYTILDQNELSTEVATFPPNQGLGKIREGDNVKIIIVKEN